MRPLLLALFLLPLCLFAQKRDMINLSLKATLEKADPESSLPVYLRGNVDGIITFVRSNGGTVKGLFNGFVATTLPVSAFAKIDDEEAITFVEFNPYRPEALSDVVLLNNNVQAVHQGVNPLPEAYRGKDVIIGIIDTGMELYHPDFQHEDGSTRVIALWDQRQAPTDLQRVPQPYNYGQEWTAEDINAGITNHDDQAAGHGSTVSGVAVGNAKATGDFMGVAPECDIIVIASDFNRPNWTMTVAEAVEYIFKRAEAIGKPAIVNASLGNYLGSHDGLDAAALHIDSLLDAAPGRAMICAAGNSQNWAPYHLGYEIPEADTAFTWMTVNPNSALGGPAAFFEFWTDVDNFQNARYTIGADLISPSYQFRGYAGWRSPAENLNTLIRDTIFFNNAIIGIVLSTVGQRGDQYLIQMAVLQPFSNQYRWRFATTGGGRFDCWSRSEWGMSNIVSTELPSIAAFPPIAKYRLPDKKMSIVDSWACSDKVITVGNYNNQKEFLNFNGTMTVYDVVAGAISVNSSGGPTRDFRQKPEISATGDQVLASGRLATIQSMISSNDQRLAFSGMHYLNGGTSMSSPVVAGAAALFFERCNNATYADLKEALISTANADAFTGSLPNDIWGYGKLDVFGMILSTLDPIAVSLPDIAPCEGSEGFITAEGGFADYTWNTGATGPVLTVSEPGTHIVTARDDLHCLQKSNPVTITFRESPEVPIVAFDEGTLFATGFADSWQWYLDGSAIPDADTPEFVPVTDGLYTIEATFDNGCSTFSDAFHFGVTSVDLDDDNPFLVFPNPTRDVVYLAAKRDVTIVRLTALNGKVVYEQRINLPAGQRTEIPVRGMASGLYILTLQSGNDLHNLKLAIEK